MAAQLVRRSIAEMAHDVYLDFDPNTNQLIAITTKNGVQSFVFSPAMLLALPTQLPATAGQLWNDNGMPAIS